MNEPNSAISYVLVVIDSIDVLNRLLSLSIGSRQSIPYSVLLSAALTTNLLVKRQQMANARELLTARHPSPRRCFQIALFLTRLTVTTAEFGRQTFVSIFSLTRPRTSLNLTRNLYAHLAMFTLANPLSRFAVAQFVIRAGR